jgi:outer membrane protein assembly factor BamB
LRDAAKGFKRGLGVVAAKRIALSALLLLCGCGRAAPPGSATSAGLLEMRVRGASPSVAVPASIAQRKHGLRLLWRFGVGSPIAGVARIAENGAVYVAAREGYVHAIAPDGRYDWSYTLLGGVAGAPAIAGGALFVGTVAGRVFSLSAGGSLNWVFRLPVPVLSDLALDRNGNLYFSESEQNLYALSPKAVAIWRAALGGFVTAGPVLAPSGELAVATSAAELVFVGPRRATERIALPAVASVPPLIDERGHTYVLSGQRLLAFDAERRQKWSLDGVKVAALEQGHLLAFRRGALVWIDRGGHAVRQVSWPDSQPAALSVDGSGTAFMGFDSGAVTAVSPDGQVARFELGDAVRSLVADGPRSRLLAATHREVVALRVPPAE